MKRKERVMKADLEKRALLALVKEQDARIWMLEDLLLTLKEDIIPSNLNDSMLDDDNPKIGVSVKKMLALKNKVRVYEDEHRSS